MSDAFDGAHVYYDEYKELGSNDFLTIVYDFDKPEELETHSDIFYIDMSLLLQAVYANEAQAHPEVYTAATVDQLLPNSSYSLKVSKTT